MLNIKEVSEQIAFNVSGWGHLFKGVIKTKMLDLTLPPRSTLGIGPALARYRFTLAREVEQSYLGCPDRFALIDDDGALTYRQFRDDSRAFAKWLRGLDVEELHFGVMARNGRGMAIPMAAKGYAGAHIYLLNVGSSAEQLEGIIKANGINVLVVDDEFLDRLPADLGDLHVVVAHESGKEHEFETLREIVNTPQPAKLPMWPKHGKIVLMSSGTTGIPKGVVRSEPTRPFVIAGILETTKMRADMRAHLTASMFHTWGWSMFNLAIAARYTVITHRVFDPELTLAQIEKYKSQVLFSSPIFYKEMAQLENTYDYDTSSLEAIASSGHALSLEIVRVAVKRFGPILSNFYGSTELSLATVADAETVAKDPTITGVPALGTRMRLLDDEGNEVPQGEIGRIFVSNSTVMESYTDPSIPIDRSDSFIAMGDVGYFDERGYLHVMGRSDDMIIVGGENVYPSSVHDVLESMPGIADLAVEGVKDAQTFERIAVWVVREDSEEGQALTEDSVREWVAKNLADHSIPRDVTFMDELPRTVTGKVLKRLLPHRE